MKVIFKLYKNLQIYITLYKINSLNEYVKIVSSLNTNKNGILYLDSGNYFEVFD